MEEVKIHRNDDGGFQIELKGVLVTIQPNPHHGLSGSLGYQENGKTFIIPFHGESRKVPFPLHVHEAEPL